MLQNHNSSIEKETYLLEVKISITSVAEILRYIRASLVKKHKFYIVTPNPEQVMLAQKDKLFKKIINEADFSVPDGIGLVQAIKYLSLRNFKFFLVKPLLLLFQGIAVGLSTIINKSWLTSKIHLIKGRELFWEILALANKKRLKIYLLGGYNNLANHTKDCIKANFKKLEIKANDGPNLNLSANPINSLEVGRETFVVREINDFKPDILFVNFGAPKQEKWLAKWWDKLDIGGAMVVGRTFEWITGKSKLAPNFISSLGLEWLWRLFTGSQNIQRIFNVFPTFPVKVFLYKLSQNQ